MQTTRPPAGTAAASTTADLPRKEPISTTVAPPCQPLCRAAQAVGLRVGQPALDIGRGAHATADPTSVLAVSATAADLPRGPERFRTLWRLWRNERADPEPFYRLLAAYAVEDLDAHHGPLRGQTIADLGCGPGYYTYAFRDRGAVVIPIDNSTDELELGGTPPPGYVLGDAGALPLEDGCGRRRLLLQHARAHAVGAEPIVAEIERVLKPGGWAYISWTNWYSPWGGHLMAPYHYLGPKLGSAPLREAPRQAREARLRRDALGLPHRCDAAPRAQPPRPGDHRRRAALLAVGHAHHEDPGPARARLLELRHPRAARGRTAVVADCSCVCAGVLSKRRIASVESTSVGSSTMATVKKAAVSKSGPAVLRTTKPSAPRAAGVEDLTGPARSPRRTTCCVISRIRRAARPVVTR